MGGFALLVASVCNSFFGHAVLVLINTMALPYPPKKTSNYLLKSCLPLCPLLCHPHHSFLFRLSLPLTLLSINHFPCIPPALLSLCLPLPLCLPLFPQTLQEQVIYYGINCRFLVPLTMPLIWIYHRQFVEVSLNPLFFKILYMTS